MSEQRKILVVANETLNGEELLDAVRKRVAGNDDAIVLVIAPVNAPREGYVVYENTRRAAAGRRLDKALEQLREQGSRFRARRRQRPTRRGEGRDRDGGARRARRLHPSGSQVRLAAAQPARGDPEGGRRSPVEHVVSDVASRTGAQNILVVANETVLGAPLLDRIREKARAAGEGTSFLIISPQSDPDRGSHPEADRRLRQVLAQLRSEGIEAHGQVAHPDPFTAAMNAVRDESIDAILVSTFPEQRGSSWLRRDLIGRLTSEADVPVEHVVVEPSEVSV